MSALKKYWFYLLLLLAVVVIYKPLFVSHQIPFSSNLLASFFSPWSYEKFPGWSQGIPNKPLGIDDLRIFYPQRKFTIDMLHMGQLPFWNPYNYSGNFHAGLSETAVFYPLFLLFLFLPQLPVWVLLQFAEPVLAGIGTYLFLRLLVKEKSAAAFGAMVFALSGVVLVRMVEGLSVGHTLIWLPFAFYGLLAFSQKMKVRYLIVATLALCLSLFAGWFQYTFYIVLLSFLYAVFLFAGSRNKKDLLLFSPFVVLPLLTLIHIVPALQTLQVSTRSDTTTQELLNLHLMPWYHLLTYLSPDFWGNPGTYNFFGKSEYKESILYIGTIPFFVSLFSFGFLKNKTVWFFAVMSVIGVLLGIDTPVARSILSLPVPIVSSFLPNRIFLLSTFGLSVLAAYGLSYLLIQKKVAIKLYAFALIIIGVVFVIADGYAIAINLLPDRFAKITILNSLYITLQHWLQFLTTSHMTINTMQLGIFTKNLILPNVFLLLFLCLLLIRSFINKRIFLLGIFLLTIVGQIYFAQKYIPWSSPQFVFPPNPVFSYLQKNQGINRFISLGQGYISSDIPLFFDLYSPDGVGSMYIQRYGELVTYVQNHGQANWQIPRIEIRIDPSTKPLFVGMDLYMQRFMQIDGITYAVKLRNESSDPQGMITSGTPLFSLVWQNNTWQIFRFNNALPRAFWTNDYVVKTNNTAILSELFDMTASPKRIVLEQKPPIAIDIHATGSVNVLQYQPQHIVLQSNATGNGLIFLSDTYAKEFTATVDGKRTEILRADYAFRAVAVPKGKHTIVISYDMTPEVIAFVFSLVSIVGIVLGFILLQREFRI